MVGGCARHLDVDGLLVSGFQLGRGYELVAYDAHCRAQGLALVERWSTWDRDPLDERPSYAVSVHRRTGGTVPGETPAGAVVR